MGFHLVAIAAATGFVQVFQLSAPLLWPLNLWLPLARHLPEACAVFYGALTSHVAWLRRAYARGRNVWSHSRRGGGGGGAGAGGSGGVDELVRQALLNISY